MNRVLIAGASGFIGEHCFRLCEELGYEVHGVSRHHLDVAPTGSYHVADLTDPHDVRRVLATVRPTHLLALAWPMREKDVYSSPRNVEWVGHTLQLVKQFVDCGGKRVVVAGTGYEYDLRFGLCNEERTPCRPRTAFGQCKQALHLLLKAYAAQCGLSLAWARIFFAYGPGEPPERLVHYTIRQLTGGRQASFSHGQQTRDYLHVHDIADALTALLTHGAEGAFNIASGEAITVRGLVEQIAERLNASSLLRVRSRSVSSREPALLVAETGRLRETLKWSPKYSLAQGIDHTLQWYYAQQRAPRVADSGRER